MSKVRASTLTTKSLSKTQYMDIRGIPQPKTMSKLSTEMPAQYLRSVPSSSIVKRKKIIRREAVDEEKEELKRNVLEQFEIIEGLRREASERARAHNTEVSNLQSAIRAANLSKNNSETHSMLILLLSIEIERLSSLPKEKPRIFEDNSKINVLTAELQTLTRDNEILQDLLTERDSSINEMSLRLNDMNNELERVNEQLKNQMRKSFGSKREVDNQILAQLGSENSQLREQLNSKEILISQLQQTLIAKDSTSTLNNSSLSEENQRLRVNMRALESEFHAKDTKLQLLVEQIEKMDTILMSLQEENRGLQRRLFENTRGGQAHEEKEAMLAMEIERLTRRIKELEQESNRVTQPLQQSLAESIRREEGMKTLNANLVKRIQELDSSNRILNEDLAHMINAFKEKETAINHVKSVMEEQHSLISTSNGFNPISANRLHELEDRLAAYIDDNRRLLERFSSLRNTHNMSEIYTKPSRASPSEYNSLSVSPATDRIMKYNRSPKLVKEANIFERDKGVIIMTQRLENERKADESLFNEINECVRAYKEAVWALQTSLSTSPSRKEQELAYALSRVNSSKEELVAKTEKMLNYESNAMSQMHENVVISRIISEINV